MALPGNLGPTHSLSWAQTLEAVAWVDDAYGGHPEPWTGEQVERFIAEHYDGGLAQFAADTDTLNH